MRLCAWVLPFPLFNTVYDLYCGTEHWGWPRSSFAKQVIGIELSPEAVLDAQENLIRNGISNVQNPSRRCGTSHLRA